MKITCLVDNTVGYGTYMWGEHGLAFLIETGAGRVLFDTGQSGAVLLHNMGELKAGPETIDQLAISHAHYDHSGGLPALLERARPGLPLYANPDLFRERFSRDSGRPPGSAQGRPFLVIPNKVRNLGSAQGRPRSIGLPLARQARASQVALHLGADPQEIQPGIWTTGEIAPRPEPEGRSAQHLVRGEEGWLPDPYQDDMALVIEMAAGLLLLCGCCHAGLLNTLYHVQRTFERPVVAIAGGTHLVSADAGYLQHVGEVLVGMETVQRIFLNHCSGEAAFHFLQLLLGPSVVRACPAGTPLDLEAFS